MLNVTKIAPKEQEGQERMKQLEAEMWFVLKQISENERILRQAEEAREELTELRSRMAEATAEYQELLQKESVRAV